MGEMDAIVKEFIAETRENLDRLDRDLVELETNPAAKEQLDSIFRAIHSIKGATGFLGFHKLGAVAHVGEGLLSGLREGVLSIDPQITSGLLGLVDCVRRTLHNIEQSGVEGEMGDAAVIEGLTRLQENRIAPRASVPSGGHGKEFANVVPAPSPAKTAVNEQDTPPDRKGPGQGVATNSSVRVDVKQLDKLMNLVGELVLARNELLQFSSVQQNAVPLGTSQRLNAITTELQDEIMKVRMQPIENVWNKFPRLVRDLALHAGKKVRLDMSGKETELDKTLIEAITDPLTHLVRNAVDHGLETPDVRAAAGKPIEGHLLLRSSHAGGQVDIEISDDGAGVDLTRVKHKAVELGLATVEQSRHMSDVEAMNLLFLPGFSTAENVTSISGRGVGMDVVKTNIEKIGGAVSIESRRGLGTQVKIRIPLTLAIMPALVVTAGGNRYAIPQVSVLELTRLEGNEVQKGIEMIQSAAVYRLRGELLPLIWLDAELKTRRANSAAPVSETGEVANIAFLQAGDQKFGLVVDEINDTQEIVVKPLGRQLRGMSTFAGATIMGDGEVVLILDVLGLAQHAHVIPELRDEKTIGNALPQQEPIAERQSLLLFVGPDDARMAVPLSQVTRLEEFSSSSLEHTAGEEVVQYRGDILPLVNIRVLLPERRASERHVPPKNDKGKMIQAIVYSKGDCRVGLVVEDIVDTVEHSLVDLRPASREGVLASVVIHGRVTEILDLEVICSDLMSRVLRKQPVEATEV
jgi:two-component system chemotaxis sensor kinase CheA